MSRLDLRRSELSFGFLQALGRLRLGAAIRTTAGRPRARRALAIRMKAYKATVLALAFAAFLANPAQAQPSLYAEVKHVVQTKGQSPTDSRRLHQTIAKEASAWLPPDFTDQQMSEALRTRAATVAIIRGYLKATHDPLARFTEKGPVICKWYPNSGVTGILLESKPWRVKNVIDGGPAQKAGVKPGDLIISVGGLPVTEHSEKWLSNQLTGEPGRVVDVALERHGSPFLVDLTRERFPFVFSKMLGHSVGYIKVPQLDDDAPGRVVAAVEQLNLQGMKAVVLDLRNSVGGDLGVGLDIAANFLPTGAPYLDVVGRNSIKSFVVKRGTRSSKPMVVLINDRTYGQSEVLASAMHDSIGATLVGQGSAGKALGVGQVYRLSTGDLLLMREGRFRAPSGRYLDSHGLQPDLAVAPQPESDAQLESALHSILFQ